MHGGCQPSRHGGAGFEILRRQTHMATKQVPLPSKWGEEPPGKYIG
jgi:hypothetical protein